MWSILLYYLLAVVHAASFDSRGLPKGVTIVPLFMDVQAFPDGPMLQLNGTLKEMHKEILEINPNYLADFNLTVPNRTTLAPREDSYSWIGCHIICGQTYGTYPKIALGDDITYINWHPGRPHLQPGPNVCSRVACEYGASIFVCNDTPVIRILEGWMSVENGFWTIWRACIGDSEVNLSGGQAFHPTGWNVIIYGPGGYIPSLQVC
ncbi:Uncharacterized protein TCAP_00781 [Tolypocladium capitatum]|uniref:Uncharacterized protein n=1 Tax=Tolypocladium capitatum TaxID=45235 RepID=A0A2K3QP24_9HYPO|nr:Uncharacterized protein TCAP_00781 [Tolypocladium capitatum]